MLRRRIPFGKIKKEDEDVTIEELVFISRLPMLLLRVMRGILVQFRVVAVVVIAVSCRV